MAYIF